MTISPAVATIIAAIGSALISAAVTLIVSVKANKRKSEDDFSELKEQNRLVLYRLDQLEIKVGQHNHFEAKLISLEEQVKALRNRLESA